MDFSINYLAIAAATLVPAIFGAIYYGPLFGKQWLASMGKTQEEMQPKNMPLTYGFSMLMSFLAAMSIKMIMELTHKNVSDTGELIFGSFHTFKHGALHGTILALLLVCPILVSFGIFTKLSPKSILLAVIFWVICFAVMGGILDVWV